MAAKPYHAGHDGLVRLAAEENDAVMLFVSTSDRTRSGELRVSGDTMQNIWWDFIEPTLPSNVTPDYGGIPVSKVYAELEKAESNDSTNIYVIYSDEEDILKYTDENLQKVAPRLFANGQIKRRSVSRSETVQVSGTEMRELIEDGDLVGFVALLPPAIRKNGKEIFDLLQDDIVGEGLLRKYIKTLLEHRG
jgi:nicotinamide mononucleotide adenylyltransferase